MKIFTSTQIRKLDQLTIEQEPIESIKLMERAASQLLKVVLEFFNASTKIAILSGPGNNGGDAVALARFLVDNNFPVTLFIIDLGGNISKDNQKNIERLNEYPIEINTINSSTFLPDFNNYDVIVDGILGSGLTRPVSGWLEKLFSYINNSDTTIVSIDIPSGLFSEDNRENNGAIICAHHTISFQFPKLAFMFPENETYVGHWLVRPIGLLPEGIKKESTPFYYTDIENLPELKNRRKFAHKGDFGHALLVAGSYGKTGAALLAAKSCLHSGVGLLSVHVPQTAYCIIQSMVPEAMVIIDETEQIFCTKEALQPYNCIGIGPGIGKKRSMRDALTIVLKNTENPMVLDADALNIISEQPELLEYIPPFSIITPHPKEFDRLTNNHITNYERLQTAREFSKKHKLIVVLKGANTAVITPDTNTHFNASGNPGLAKGGSGDTLTGIILGLLASKYSPKDAAILGVFIHGLAADIAVEFESEESLTASHVINHIGRAFNQIRETQEKNKKPQQI